jgi:AraC-like DNA-binding protein
MAITSKGILNPILGAEKFSLSRHSPSEDLAYFIERYWIIHWDLRGQAPYVSENLPYPCVNLVFERGKSGIFGVVSGKYSHLLNDKGSVFGVKFRVGGFYPFIKFPVSRLTDTCISLEAVFDIDADKLTDEVLSRQSPETMIEAVENFLRPRLPEKDRLVEELNLISDTVIEHSEIRKVEDLMAYLPFGKRHLQRLFKQYVGVSPKWLIQRYRLHEAAEQVAKSRDWAQLAVELGYFDQAHFIKDFKAMIGKTPMEYASMLQSLR